MAKPLTGAAPVNYRQGIDKDMADLVARNGSRHRLGTY